MRSVAETPRVGSLDPRVILEYQSRGYILLEDAVDHTQLDAAALSLQNLASGSSKLERSDRYNKSDESIEKVPESGETK